MTTNNQPDHRTIRQKYEELKDLIRTLGKVAVAYSGGVDSTFLLKAASEAPASKLIALTVKQVYTQHWELDEASAFVGDLGVTHRIIEPPADEKVLENPVNRCYLCKSGTFTIFRDEMEKLGYDTLIDGTNVDDTGEHRPGMRAVREHGVRSPLLETGFTKKEIREMSRILNIPDWDKPSNTCLITRVPYNTKVSNEDLRQIENAELFLMKQGFKQVRVRKHGDTARIEVDPHLIGKLVESENINKIVPYLKSIGFAYISLDLEGYKTGSLDKTILKQPSEQ